MQSLLRRGCETGVGGLRWQQIRSSHTIGNTEQVLLGLGVGATKVKRAAHLQICPEAHTDAYWSPMSDGDEIETNLLHSASSLKLAGVWFSSSCCEIPYFSACDRVTNIGCLLKFVFVFFLPLNLFCTDVFHLLDEALTGKGIFFLCSRTVTDRALKLHNHCSVIICHCFHFFLSHSTSLRVRDAERAWGNMLPEVGSLGKYGCCGWVEMERRRCRAEAGCGVAVTTATMWGAQMLWCWLMRNGLELITAGTVVALKWLQNRDRLNLGTNWSISLKHPDFKILFVYCTEKSVCAVNLYQDRELTC